MGTDLRYRFWQMTMDSEARLKMMLKEFFGPRCVDASGCPPDCECCKRWSAFDTLMANPFKDDSPIKDRFFLESYEPPRPGVEGDENHPC